MPPFDHMSYVPPLATPLVIVKAGAGRLSRISGVAPCVVQTNAAVALLMPSVADTTTL